MESLKCPELLLDSLENGHFVIDSNFIVSYWNRWLSINTQISSDEIVGKSLVDFYPDIDSRIFKRKINTALKLNSPTFYDSSSMFLSIVRDKVTKTDLSFMKQQVTISPYMVAENKVMVSVYDISNLYETKLWLKDEILKVNKLNQVLKDDKDIIDKNIMTIKTDIDGKITYVSSLFCKFFGYKKKELLGQKVGLLKSGEMPTFIYKELWETILSNKPWSGEIENKTRDGQSKWVQIRVTPIVSKNDELIEFNAVYQDVTNKKLLEELYITDPLTQLNNRRYFDEMMSAISKKQRKADMDFAILIADIDNFKVINDTYGHQVGDEVLKKVAQTLKSKLRDNDVIARWGGEEFVIMLKNIDLNEAQMIAQKLRMSIQECKINENINITISIGFTKYIVGEDTNATFKRADKALYKAKQRGRNKVVIEL
nr:diguanylate cyclase [uncultured Sulfurimonas sp.]